MGVPTLIKSNTHRHAIVTLYFTLAFARPAYAHMEGFEYIVYGMFGMIVLALALIYAASGATRRKLKADRAAGKLVFNHENHFLLSLLTVGIWTPVWLVSWLIYRARKKRRGQI